MDPKTEAGPLINTKSRAEVSTLSEQESTAIKIRKTNFVWISNAFFNQIERRLSVVNIVKTQVVKREGEFEFEVFFLIPRQGHVHGATCWIGHVTFLFQGRVPPSLIHGRASPPLLTRGLEGIFCSPTWTPEGFHLRAFRGHGGGGGNISRFCLSLFWRDNFWYRFIGRVFY